MKVVFLDFDGVLNCESNNPNCYQIGNQFYPPFDIDKVELLNELLVIPRVILMVCSSWREQLTRVQMEAWLKINDVKYNYIIHLDDKETIDERGLAIINFLINSVIKDFVILDDEPWWYKNYELLKSKHIRTDKIIGLTKENIDSAKKILFGEYCEH